MKTELKQKFALTLAALVVIVIGYWLVTVKKTQPLPKPDQTTERTTQLNNLLLNDNQQKET